MNDSVNNFMDSYNKLINSIGENSVYGIIILFILVVIVILIFYNLLAASKCRSTESMIDIKPLHNPNFSRSKCDYRMGETMQKVLSENNINDTKKETGGGIQLTCGYDEIDKEINKLNPSSDQRIHIIHNADHVSAKDYLWNRLVISAGIDKAKTIMPNTYILKNNVDRQRLQHDFKPGNLYIMKKNIQRQEGLKITNSLDEMLSAPASYVLTQELLQDPYVINVSQDPHKMDNRKINMRFYVLVVCKDTNMDVYVFNDGFMYYTAEPFRKGTTESGPNVTTGYCERTIYEQNPLTHGDFKQYLDRTDRPLTVAEENVKSQGLKIGSVVFNRIYNLLREVFTCIIGKACEGDRLRNNVSFQLFGADIAINDQLWPMIMEVNKGPNIGPHGGENDRDPVLKRKVVKDMLKIVGAVQDNEPNGFMQIINKEGDELGKVCI
ncbi:MAG: tubulin-tyrosine ligase family protein [Terrestrivirus sp.]|uniref:Tubulin-tyrosine ligase family protein n=1 Tax=Terrestrivirus sp. TaxID=2487775 RepID=A0A3G4ZM23_9VIRU|nr:MAG: tubulin-tyrosine ligase family protein [Terrestrivirus sp.]